MELTISNAGNNTKPVIYYTNFRNEKVFQHYLPELVPVPLD